MQLDDDPNENQMNSSEIHLNKIMNIKVTTDNTYCIYQANG